MIRGGPRIQRMERPLQLTAIVLWCVSCAVGFTALTICLVTNAKVQAHYEFAQQEQQRLTAEGDDLEARLRSEGGRVQEVADAIARELEEKRKLHVAMSEVLARARVLQEQRARFNTLRSQIETRLNKMDEYYYRARQQAPAVKPP